MIIWLRLYICCMDDSYLWRTCVGHLTWICAWDTCIQWMFNSRVYYGTMYKLCIVILSIKSSMLVCKHYFTLNDWKKYSCNMKCNHFPVFLGKRRWIWHTSGTYTWVHVKQDQTFFRFKFNGSKVTALLIIGEALIHI